MIHGDHTFERRAGRWVGLLTGAFTLLMLGSLVWGYFDQLYFSSDGRHAQGIDFFSTPKAFRNLLEGRSMYDSWGGTAYGPYSTWYLMHPAFAVFIASYFALFDPWASYAVFTVATLVTLLGCGRLVSGLTPNRFERQMAYACFLCSFVTYWLLYVGNLHVVTVLSLTLLLVGMYQLAFGGENARRTAAVDQIGAGLLISLLSKPVLLLVLPVCLLNRETRRRCCECLVVYVAVSFAFLVVPALNPEGIGLAKVLRVAMDPTFVRTHLNVYTNQFVLNEYMKDNAIHWLNIVAQSGSYWNHIDIFALSAFANTAWGAELPPALFQVPIVVVLSFSIGTWFVADDRERLRISLLVVIASTFSYFLAYNTVWEYQHASLFPCVAILFLMHRRQQLEVARGVSLLILLLCASYYLPSPYVLARGPQVGVADFNAIRSTKVLSSLACFGLLASIIATRLGRAYGWVSRRTPPAEATGHPGLPRTV